jgi:hypothetical protein
LHRVAERSDISLVELELGGDPEPWEQLGFHVYGGAIALGATRLHPTGRQGGILGWKLAGVSSDRLDGLRTTVVDAPPEPPPPVSHPNGVTRIDHLVVRSPWFDQTVHALEAAGLALRREREGPHGLRQGFFWVGDTILELVSDNRPEATVGFWGLTVVSADLDATAAFLGDRLGEVRDAVQPGRRIATVARDAGHGFPLAIMTPHVRSDEAAA